MTATKPARKGRKAPISRRGILLFVVPVVDKAARLDREADVALSYGHHGRAERLAWRAAELRARA